MKSLVVFVSVFLFAVVTGYGTAYGKGADINSMIELLRSDIKTAKKEVITKAMQFTDEEAAAFWRVYSQYEFEATQIGDDMLALIKDYANNLQDMTDEKAKELVKRSFDIENKQLKLKKKYFKKIEKVLSPIKAAKFIQIENQIRRAIEMQISATLPLIE